jgi:hypothetical protein
MDRRPVANETLLSRGQAAVEWRSALDGDDEFVTTVAGVNVRYPVLADVHVDDDSIER